MALTLLKAEDLRIRLLGLFDLAGPFVARDLSVRSGRIRLGGGTSALGGLGGLPGIGGVPPPRASYQWLLFEEIDGGSPAGEQIFTFEGPSIPFVGAVTEIDLIAEGGTGNWQVNIEIAGLGPIFRTSQSGEDLAEAGFFRPIPPGFWPETEGITFPLPGPGYVPRIRFRRPDSAQANLVFRLFMVAHPAF